MDCGAPKGAPQFQHFREVPKLKHRLTMGLAWVACGGSEDASERRWLRDS